jgi:hypothetical protein
MLLGAVADLDAVAGGSMAARADEEVIDRIQLLAIVQGGLGHGHFAMKRKPNMDMGPSCHLSCNVSAAGHWLISRITWSLVSVL